MDLEYLFEFALLADVGNYQKTSELLYISQSTLSKHILKLEKELGVDLIDRTKRDISLTEIGKRFLIHANEMNNNHQKFLNSIMDLNSNFGNKISIGYVASDIIEEIPNFIQRFKLENPNSQIRVSHFEYTDLQETLRNNINNIIIIPELEGTQEKEFNILSSNEYVNLQVVMPINHRFKLNKQIELKDIKDDVFIMNHRTSFMSTLTERIFKDAGYHQNVEIRVNKVENSINLVESGMGITIIGDDISEKYKERNIKIIKFSPNVRYRSVAKYSKNRKLLPEEEWVLNYLKNKWSV